MSTPSSVDVATSRPVADSETASASNFPDYTKVTDKPVEPDTLDSNAYPIFKQLRPEAKCKIYILSSTGESIIEPIDFFILTELKFAETERASIHETEGGFVVTFLDTAPVMVTVKLALANYQNHPNRDLFRYYYRKYLRGTMLAKQKAKVVISADGMVIKGAFSDFLWADSTNDMSDSTTIAMLSMITNANDIYSVTLGIDGSKIKDYQYPDEMQGIVRDLIQEEKDNRIPASKMGVNFVF